MLCCLQPLLGGLGFHIVIHKKYAVYRQGMDSEGGGAYRRVSESPFLTPPPSVGADFVAPPLISPRMGRGMIAPNGAWLGVYRIVLSPIWEGRAARADLGGGFPIHSDTIRYTQSFPSPHWGLGLLLATKNG